MILANKIKMDPNDVMTLNDSTELVNALVERQEGLLDGDFGGEYMKRLSEDLPVFLGLCVKYAKGELKKAPERATMSTTTIVEEAPSVEVESTGTQAMEEEAPVETVTGKKGGFTVKGKLGKPAVAEEPVAETVEPEIGTQEGAPGITESILRDTLLGIASSLVEVEQAANKINGVEAQLADVLTDIDGIKTVLLFICNSVVIADDERCETFGDLVAGLNGNE